MQATLPHGFFILRKIIIFVPDKPFVRRTFSGSAGFGLRHAAPPCVQNPTYEEISIDHARPDGSFGRRLLRFRRGAARDHPRSAGDRARRGTFRNARGGDLRHRPDRLRARRPAQLDVRVPRRIRRGGRRAERRADPFARRGGRSRELPAGDRTRTHRDRGRRCGRYFLRIADAAAAPRSVRRTDPGAHDQRCTPLRLPRHDARRVAPFPQQGVRQAAARPDGALQAQPLPLASDRRRRLAYRDQEPSAADRLRRVAPLCRLGRLELRRQTLLPSRRSRGARRLLYAGRYPRGGGVRPPAAHHGDSRDRDARTQRGGAGRLSRPGVQPPALRELRLLHRQRGDLPVRGGGALGGDRAVPLEIHPHRRRRSLEGGLAELSALPGPDAKRRAERCRRAAELHDPPRREVPQCQRPRSDRLGRDSRGRTGTQRHGDVVAGRRGRHRRGGTGPPRRDDAVGLLLSRLLPGRSHARTARRGRVPHATPGLFLRSGARYAAGAREADDPRRAGQSLVRARPDGRARRAHALAPHARHRRGGVEPGRQ